MTKQVKDLKTGDVLSSGTTVITGPVESLSLPKGKVAISVRYANGNHKIAVWGKYTNVRLRA